MLYIKSGSKWLRKYRYHFSIAGIIFYNNWLLGLFLNPHASLLGATTSELSVKGQPWAIVFQVGDIFAGLFFLLGIFSMSSTVFGRKESLVLTFATFSLGLSTIFEIFVPMDCSTALSTLCAQKERLGQLSWHHNLHIIESPITYSFMLLFPLSIIWAAKHQKEVGRLITMNWLLVATMALCTVADAITYSLHGEKYGYAQRIFNIVFSIWFIKVVSFSKVVFRDK